MYEYGKDSENVKWFKNMTFMTDYVFVKTKEEFYNLMKYFLKSEYNVPILPEKSPGFIKSFTNIENSLITLIYIDFENCKTVRGFLGILAHEVTHVKQEMLKHIGEINVGSETEAYLIQEIFNDGYYAYEEMHGKDFLLEKLNLEKLENILESDENILESDENAK